MQLVSFTGNWYGTPVPPMEADSASCRETDASGLTMPLTEAQLQLLRRSVRGQRSNNVQEELPYGWQRVNDSHFGTFYVDQVNKRSQYDKPGFPQKGPIEADKHERFTVAVAKGLAGFGFKLATSRADGRQRVKEVTEPHRCTLQVGDILLAVDRHDVRTVSHAELVALLQSYPPNASVSFVVERASNSNSTQLRNAAKSTLLAEAPRMLSAKSSLDLRDAASGRLGGSLSNGLDLSSLPDQSSSTSRNLLNTTPDFIPASLLLRRSPATSGTPAKLSSVASNLSKSLVHLDAPLGNGDRHNTVPVAPVSGTHLYQHAALFVNALLGV